MPTRITLEQLRARALPPNSDHSIPTDQEIKRAMQEIESEHLGEELIFVMSLPHLDEIPDPQRLF
jgi:hypothetical protein